MMLAIAMSTAGCALASRADSPARAEPEMLYRISELELELERELECGPGLRLAPYSGE